MINRFERFSLALFEISRCWHKLTAAEMIPYGLKGPHAIYLVVMRRYPDGVTAAQLSELCSRDKADVSRAVALMEERGLIRREGVNRNLYRARLVLTDTGRLAAAHVCERARVAVDCAGKDISPEHREIFYAVLESVTANLQTLSKEGIPESCKLEEDEHAD